MRGIGHFPISENYPLCKTYLWPALLELAGAQTAPVADDRLG